MAKFSSAQKYNLKKLKMSNKQRTKEMKLLNKNQEIKNQGKRSTAEVIGRSVTQTASALATPMAGTSVTRSYNDRKIAEMNQKYNVNHYQDALDKWLDQMDGKPESSGDSGSDGTNQKGSTTETSKYGSF